MSLGLLVPASGIMTSPSIMTPEGRNVRTDDGLKLHALHWSPARALQGTLWVIPGLGEHSGRYRHVGTFFSQQGWEVWIPDLRGHGHSEGTRCHVDSWFDYFEDLRTLQKHSGPPNAILAHSMGGLLAVDWLGHLGTTDRLLLSSPLLGIALELPAWKLALSKVLSTCLPKLAMANEIPLDALCTDPEVIARVQADPFYYRKATPRWYIEMRSALARVRQQASRFATPISLHCADDDRVTNSKRAQEWLLEIQGPKEQTIWPQTRHEILQEPCRGQVMQAMNAWLTQAIST